MSTLAKLKREAAKVGAIVEVDRDSQGTEIRVTAPKGFRFGLDLHEFVDFTYRGWKNDYDDLIDRLGLSRRLNAQTQSAIGAMIFNHQRGTVMRIQVINVDDGTWSDLTEPQSWLRLVIDDVSYDVMEAGNGLAIRTIDGPMQVDPVASNSVNIFDRINRT